MNNFSSITQNPGSSPIIVSLSSEPNKDKILTTFHEITKIWEKSGWKSLLPAKYDETTGRILLNLKISQMKTLAKMHQIFFDIAFDRAGNSRFEGYFNKYDCHFQEPNLIEFGEEAEQRLKEFPCERLQVPFPCLPDERTPAATLKSWLSSHQGLIIGETHHEFGAKRLIVDQMELFANWGVGTIFLEFLRKEEQEALDLYLKSDQEDLPLPPEVEASLWSQDASYNHPRGGRLLDILQTAKKYGIRVVGLETEESTMFGYDNYMGHFAHPKERAIGLNYVAKNIIDQEKGQQKYVVLVGNSHVSFHCQIPGLSELLGIPGFLLFDRDQSPTKIGYNVSKPIKGLTGTYQAVFVQGREIQPIERVEDHTIFTNLDRAEEQNMLQTKPVGSWLVRNSTSRPGSYVLTLKEDIHLINYYICNDLKSIHGRMIELTVDAALQVKNPMR